MKRTHITTDDLKGACSGQVKLFEATFKGKAKITQKNMEIAAAAGLGVLWLSRLIPDSARDECKKDAAAAWAEYVKVWNAARDKHDKVRDAARDGYEKDAAWTEYEKARDAARVEYEKARLGALVVALTQAIASQQVSV